ncbi:monocarboxylate transporter 2 [Fusarium fujikuroi]|nr:monocarboxylate transporter 2 [Fusarium fujikuroi]KLP13149.1 monocarboxylate transporter 2 [Fusarium fujikuroi]
MDPDIEQAKVEKPNPEQPKPGTEFPDGGVKAWSVVLGSFCGLFVSFGWTNCASWSFSSILRSKSVEGLVTEHCLMDTGPVDVYDVHYGTFGWTSL